MASAGSPEQPPPPVVLFSLAECPHCKKAKALLEDLGHAYEDISLSSYPEKRTDMLQLAERLTVPQIFVRGRHIGGSSELRELADAGRLQALLDAEPDGLASDPRLRRPAYEAKVVVLPDAPLEPQMCIGGECIEYPSLVRVLLDGVEVSDRKQRLGLKTVKRCFEGKALVDFAQLHFKLKAREEGLQVARMLLHSEVFSPATGSGKVFSEQELYRFQAHTTGLWSALNAARRWCTPDGCVSDAVSDPLGVLKRLKKQLGQLVSAHTDGEGMVDYVAMAADPSFAAYEDAIGELQLVDLAKLEPVERRAFVVNLYNTIVPHAFAKLGVPDKDLARVTFFDGVCYELGGSLLSLNDLENGVLRGNRTAPFHLRKPFDKSSKALGAVLPCDHRIHFALNCGAKSCPPVKWFTKEALDEELRIVAMAWVEQAENVKVDVPARTLWLSKICSWYSSDFGADRQAIARCLLQHMRGKQQEDMESLMKGKFSIKHMHYDWSTNSRNAVKFSETCLTCFLK